MYLSTNEVLMDNENFDLSISLDEMRINIQQSLDSGDALDRKLNQTIVSSGAIISITTTLQLTLDWNKSSLYWFIFYFVIGLYTLNVVVALLISGPKSYKLPISPEWKVLEQEIFDKTPREIYSKLLSGYVDQIKNNREINTKKAKAYYFCSVTIPISIILLCVLAVVK